MKTKIHAFAGVVGFLTIAVFWSSTMYVEFFGSKEAIITVKNSILWGMALLIPSMAVAGGSGMSLGQGRTDSGVISKKKRMPIIAINGLFVLVPSAFFLASKANAGEFDAVFYIVQVIELVGGATNLTLIGLNIRDGLRLTGKIPIVVSQATSGTPTIQLGSNGPAIVKDLQSFIGSDGRAITIRPVMALCRCGASKNKPYCDGSHSKHNFSGEKSSNHTADETITYEGKEITIEYNRLLCSKASECGKRLHDVFDTSRDPWIDPDRGSVDDIIEVVRACPSGALRYTASGRLPCHEIEVGSAITIEKNGPYLVRNVVLENEAWNDGACADKFALCRCGASKNKPFCDGSHTSADFED